MPNILSKTSITPTFNELFTVNVGSITNGTTGIITLATGKKQVLPANVLIATCNDLNTGLIIGECFSDALGTIKVKIANVTGGPINPGSKTFKVIAF